jgi:hypothetical protein
VRLRLTNSVTSACGLAEWSPALEESLACFRELGDSHGIIYLLNLLANVVLAQRDFVSASQLAEKSSTLAQEHGERSAMAEARITLARVAQVQGDAARASALYSESLCQFAALGQRGKLAQGLEGLSITLSEQEQGEDAARFFGAAAVLREAMGMPVHPVDREAHERCIAIMRAKLSEETFTAAWSDGQAMPVERVLEAVDKFLSRA